ncbi:MAG: hypothetical protein ACK5XN_04610 [Bacteroidota bacterium]
MKVALDAVMGSQTPDELSTRHKVQAAMISNWKKTLTNRAGQLFDTSRGRADKTDEELTARL